MLIVRTTVLRFLLVSSPTVLTSMRRRFFHAYFLLVRESSEVFVDWPARQNNDIMLTQTYECWGSRLTRRQLDSKCKYVRNYIIFFKTFQAITDYKVRYFTVVYALIIVEYCYRLICGRTFMRRSSIWIEIHYNNAKYHLNYYIVIMF